MKNAICILCITAACFGWSTAQTPVQKKILNAGGKAIYMNFERANVKIIGWNKTDIEIKGTVNINQGDNDENFRMDVQQQATKITIETGVRDIDNMPRVTVIEMDGERHYFKDTNEGKKALEAFKKAHKGAYNSWSNGVFTEISLEVYVPQNADLICESLYGDVMLENMSSQVTVENTYGHVDFKFGEGPVSKAIKLHSTYDFVDVSVPAAAQLNLDMNTGYGEIYTNLDIAHHDNTDRSNFGAKVKGRLNGGGPEMILEATYNNIYLRKK